MDFPVLYAGNPIPAGLPGRVGYRHPQVFVVLTAVFHGHCKATVWELNLSEYLRVMLTAINSVQPQSWKGVRIPWPMRDLSQVVVVTLCTPINPFRVVLELDPLIRTVSV